ncbi:hypothetical protein PR202_ga14707 [Eleusine coracana subsp. coracana]|uniref:tRNA pseudouridine synthase n=1 Tax=Eleusine coracana subsp. coracana TaxID=191504 RepID=A0AAV5CHW4_ELECO|nr:hypothetical protein PR202_ga14707 [Eleusine coracana subsp. coracana]
MLARFRPFMTTAAKATAPPAVAISTAAAEREEHVHYKHTDACNHLRWTAKESFEYMYARPWSRLVDFYAELVRTGTGAGGLAKLFGKDEFSGKQLGQFVDERKAKQLESRSLPLEGCAVVAGRTDKGVTALQQVCSFCYLICPFLFQNCKEGLRVMCIELVANRFLRKMVRVLVATAIREAAAGAGKDALLNLMEATDRRATAPPAPPEGLCLVDVGYEEFDRQKCFIVD